MDDIKEIIEFMNIHKEFINLIGLINERLGELSE